MSLFLLINSLNKLKQTPLITLKDTLFNILNDGKKCDTNNYCSDRKKIRAYISYQVVPGESVTVIFEKM